VKPCSTCPFVIGSTNHGSPDWLKDVLGLAIHNKGKHTCHRSDPKADGYIKGQPIDCSGFEMLKVNNDVGVYVNKNVFRNFREFFISYLERYKIEGLIK
jgi:hypothetical protein